MHERSTIDRESWREKFRHAFRGFKLGVRGQSSFFVHFFFTTAVVAAGVAFSVRLIEWCLLILCISIVLAAEMFNSGLEHLARAITVEHDPDVGAALDIGSAAVLIASLGAAIVGAMVFLSRLAVMLDW